MICSYAFIAITIPNKTELTVAIIPIPLAISLFFYTQDPIYLMIGVACILISAYVERIKPYFDSPRPEGAKDCNSFCSGGSVEGKPGFPSGHVATVTLFVLLMGLYTQSYYWLLGFFWIGAMAWSRYEKRCHSVEQVAGGALVGLLGAMIGYMSYSVAKAYDFMQIIRTYTA